MNFSSSGQPNISVRPNRPPPPSAEKLEAAWQRQIIKAQLGSSPREIRTANASETSKLTIQANKEEATTKNIPTRVKKALKDWSITKYETIKSKLQTKSNQWTTKATYLKGAIKEWAKAPATNSIALGKTTMRAGAEKIKGAGRLTKNKLIQTRSRSKELYVQAKAGAKVWNAAKADVTISMAQSFYKGIKNRTVIKVKSAKNKFKSKIPSRLRFPQKNNPDIVKKSLHKRKCASEVETKKTTPLLLETGQKKRLKPCPIK